MRRASRAFTLIEAMLTVVLLGMLLIIFGAVFPLALSAGGAGAGYNQAVLIAQHKIDQLRQAGFTQLNQTALNRIGIVDAQPNSDGSLSFTYADNLVDNGAQKGYFGPGSTGSITVGQALVGRVSSPPSQANAVQVSVTVSFQGAGLHPGSFTTHTIIAAP